MLKHIESPNEIINSTKKYKFWQRYKQFFKRFMYSIRDSSNLQGRMLLSTLSEYQRSPASIPENLVGYNPQWRETFDSGGKK